MHQGAVRLAVCFMAKYGFVYFLSMLAFSLLMFCVLIVYMAGYHQALPSHLRLASNLNHLQLARGQPAAGSAAHNPLFGVVRRPSILPPCRRRAFLTVLVTSAPRNFKQRQAIRRTWCSSRLAAPALLSLIGVGGASAGHVTRCLFLLGRSLSANIQQAVLDESTRHRDIIQGAYLDSYRNLTLKVLQGFVWISQSCPSEFVLKTDDDCFVNVPMLSWLLAQSSPARNLYVGYVMDRKSQRQVIREPTSKWRVSEAEYAAEYYPRYASGSGYVLSRDLVEVIVAVFDARRLLPVEDAYVGIVLDSFGISPVHSARFSADAGRWRLCNLLYLVVIHRVSADMQSTLMTQCVQSYSNCSFQANPNHLWY